MSRSFYATRDDPYDSNRAALRPKFDVIITAAMLTGGASGGWAVAEAKITSGSLDREGHK